jgi:hypothetical protein
MDSRISSVTRLTGMRLKELVLLDRLGVHILCCHSQILDLDIASVSHRVHDSALHCLAGGRAAAHSGA